MDVHMYVTRVLGSTEACNLIYRFPVVVGLVMKQHSSRQVALICLHVIAARVGAETAITTLWPWKVKQLATEEGDNSPFAALQTDITRVLTTVLVGVTFCTIFGTALATEVAVGLFGQVQRFIDHCGWHLWSPHVQFILRARHK
jgi:hypothetical protein